jgi:hypothetical protein
MKVNTSRRPRTTASALLTALVICSIFSLFVVYYLSLIEQQGSLSSRSQTWNMAIAVTEAGIEDGLEHLNTDYPNLAGNGWSTVGAGVFYRSNTMPDGSAYTIYITNLASPVIVARAYIKPFTLAQNVPLGFLATGGVTPTTATFTRAVKVTCSRANLFTAAVAVKGNIDLNGNGVYSDSYNSTNSARSTNGQYDPQKYAGDYGDIATNGGITNSVDVQNGNIYGTLHTGPDCPVSIGPNGGIGTHNWQAKNKGINPTNLLRDANFTFPNTKFPNTSTYLTPTSGYITNSQGQGVYYDNILQGTTWGRSKYVLNSLSGNTIVTGPNVILALPNGGNDLGSISLMPGATLVTYWGGTSFSAAGNQIINSNGYAGSFIVYCSPSVTSFTLAGNGTFTGVLVAPYADISLKGSGNNQDDFCGALLGRSLTLNGHFSFHYDEALGDTSSKGRFLVSSWDEVP